MKNQIASVQESRVKDKNDFVTRHLKIFMELCIRKELDTQCTVHHALCDKPSKDIYGTVRIRLFVKFIFGAVVVLMSESQKQMQVKNERCNMLFSAFGIFMKPGIVSFFGSIKKI